MNSTSTITVATRLFGDVRRVLGHNAPDGKRLTLSEGARVSDLLAALGVGPEEELTVSLNGELAQRENELHEGDEIVLFSPMEGG